MYFINCLPYILPFILPRMIILVFYFDLLLEHVTLINLLNISIFLNKSYLFVVDFTFSKMDPTVFNIAFNIYILSGIGLKYFVLEIFRCGY